MDTRSRSVSVFRYSQLHYRLSLEAYPRLDAMQEEEESTYCSVELQLTGSSTNYRRINICLDRVVSRAPMPVSEVRYTLIEMGVARSSHVSIIAHLFEFIEKSALSGFAMFVMNMEEVVQIDDDDNDGDDEEEIVRRVRQERRLIIEAINNAFLTAITNEENGFDAVVNASLEEDISVTTTPASEEAIAGLEKLHQVEGGLYKCIICNEHGEKEFAQMPCLHVFHDNCLATWLRISAACPLCRFQLPC